MPALLVNASAGSGPLFAQPAGATALSFFPARPCFGTLHLFLQARVILRLEKGACRDGCHPRDSGYRQWHRSGQAALILRNWPVMGLRTHGYNSFILNHLCFLYCKLMAQQCQDRTLTVAVGGQGVGKRNRPRILSRTADGHDVNFLALENRKPRVNLRRRGPLFQRPRDFLVRSMVNGLTIRN